MSMNLYVEGTRKATVVVNGKKKPIIDRVSFPLWQTPTVLTNAVLALTTIDQQVNAYIKWVDSATSPVEENVYDYAGKLDENLEYPVIGRKTVYPAQEHANELRNWIQMCNDEEYSIKFYSL
jgi:hypothetical protein